MTSTFYNEHWRTLLILPVFLVGVLGHKVIDGSLGIVLSIVGLSYYSFVRGYRIERLKRDGE